MLDMNDVAEYLGKQYGGWTGGARNTASRTRLDRHSAWRHRRLPELPHQPMKTAGFDEFPKDLPGFLELCQALKKNNTPAGFALGHATGDANGWLPVVLWAHGG